MTRIKWIKELERGKDRYHSLCSDRIILAAPHCLANRISFAHITDVERKTNVCDQQTDQDQLCTWSIKHDRKCKDCQHRGNAVTDKPQGDKRENRYAQSYCQKCP